MRFRTPARAAARRRVATVGVAAAVTVAAVGITDGNTAVAAPPSNDSFATPWELFTTSTTIDWDNSEATVETDEPTPACQQTYGSSVWFEWTAPSTGIVTVKTSAFGGTPISDTVVDVFSGTSLADLSSLACDDDGGASLRSLVQFGAMSGQTYSIRVAGFSSSVGTFELSLDAVACSSINRLYVDADTSSDVRDGLGWASAHWRVQDALDALRTCEEDVNEVWVADGTYFPSQVGDQTESFVLAAGTHLLGGFDGTESTATLADPAGNITILSGDLLSDDTADVTSVTNRGDNSNQVLTMPAPASASGLASRVDGFTVSHGGAESPALGSGFYVEGAGAIVTRSRFVANRTWGGAIAGNIGDVDLIDVEIVGNHSTNTTNAPGLHVFEGEASLMNVLIADNTSAGAGAISGTGATFNVLSSTIAGNDSATRPVIEHNGNAGSRILAITNSIVAGNSSTVINTTNSGVVNVSYSDVEAWAGGGTGNVDVDPLFVDPSSGDYRLDPESPVRGIGDNAVGLPDIYDFDDDGDTTELAPDLDRNNRIIGNIDLGAYEGADCLSSPVQVFVDADATGSKSGLTWGDAFTRVEDALLLAASCESTDEIWVAEGTYTPSATGDADDRYTVDASIRLFGGFAGTETLASQADPSTHPTILSGDLNGDDGPGFANRSDNSLEVLSVSGFGSPEPGPSHIDGFTVSGSGQPGSTAPALRNFYTELDLTRMTFTDNLVGYGTIASTGGSSVVDLVAAEVVGNKATGEDMNSGVYTDFGALTNIVSSLIADNTAENGNAGVISGLGAEVNVSGSTIAGNSATDAELGGLISADDGSVSLINSIVWGNSALGSLADAIRTSGTGTVEAYFSNVEGWTGGGTGVVTTNPEFVDAGSGNYRLKNTSPMRDIGATASSFTDELDIDADGDTTEEVPDLDLADRVFGTAIDMGAYEIGAVLDTDGDGVPDASDNCITKKNANQADSDGDGIGDECDPVDDAVVFESLTPARFADSRDQDTFDGLFRNTGPRPSGTTWEVKIAGRGDVPTDATAAVINLTVLNATGPGFATVHPCGTLPKASSVNYTPGAVEPNEVIAKLSNNGTVCVYTKTTADVIIDVVGHTPNSSPYAALTPARYADSRNQPTFDNTHRNTGPRPSGTTWEIKITDRGNVPTTATAAVINLTVTGGTGPGFATVHPCGTLPKASSINYGPGITRPNELITKLSPTGTICVYTKTTVDVIIDVVGYIEDVPGYTPLTPARYADSRNETTFDNQYRNTGPRPTNSTWEIPIAGRGNIPTTATTAVVNLTVTGATGPGFATVHPCGTLPKASSINYDTTTTRPNELITKLSPTGTICIYTKTTTHIIIDIVGHT